MTARDVDGWLAHVDAYVDGTLDDQDALRLRLAAERSPELQAEIERLRAFQSALAAMPVAAPSAGFDDRVIESVPLARYAMAPRRRPVVVALGHLAPSQVQRLVAHLGRGFSALAAAWVLAMVIGSTALQGRISAGSVWLGEQFQNWAAGSAGTPVIAPVARTVSDAYDASFGALGSMESALGLGLTIFLVGALVGAAGLWAAARRRTAIRGRNAHHA